MKKKELKRKLTYALAETAELKAQLDAEKLLKAHHESSVNILREEVTEARNRRKIAELQLRGSERCHQSKITSLKNEAREIKRELALRNIELNWFLEKGSKELWSINDFLNKMAENLEQIANKRNIEGNSIKIDIIPVLRKDGLIKGYRVLVTAIEF